MTKSFFLSFVACALIFSSMANAQNFGFNFNSDREDASLSASEETGIVSHGSWNNWIDVPATNPNPPTIATQSEATIVTPNAGIVTDSDGNTHAGITVDWSSNNAWNTTNGVLDPENKLMNGYIDNDAENPTITIDVAGLPASIAADYDVIVYIGSDGNGRTGKVSVGSTTYSYTTFSEQPGVFPYPYTQTTDTADGNPDANYAVYSGQTGAAFTITLERGSNNSGIHGFQVVSAAGNLGFSFSSDREDASLLASEVAGIVPQANWNNWVGVSSAEGPADRIVETEAMIDTPNAGVVTDSDGNTHPEIGVSFAANNSYNTTNGIFESELKLMNGYLDSSAGNPQIKIDVDGLPPALAAGYDVIVYFGADGNDRIGKITVRTTTYSYASFSEQPAVFPFPFTQTTDTAEGNPQANYAVFSGVTGAAFTITLDRGDVNTGIHGFQIISAPVAGVPGDANGDGSFDFGDIEAFFLAITDLPAYTAQYPNVAISLLDMNADGNTDFGDIEAFFAAVTGG